MRHVRLAEITSRPSEPSPTLNGSVNLHERHGGVVQTPTCGAKRRHERLTLSKALDIDFVAFSIALDRGYILAPSWQSDPTATRNKPGRPASSGRKRRKASRPWKISADQKSVGRSRGQRA